VRVLLLEDDPRLADLLGRSLLAEGHTPVAAGTLAEAAAALTGPPVDLLLLDRTLPDGDGLDLLRARRAAGDPTPALLLTARDAVPDRVAGLLGGADDYLVKPFALEELLARVAALGRRAQPGSRAQIGDLVLDAATGRVWRGARELQLTALEHRLLTHLAAHPGEVHSRAQLLSEVWGLRHDPGTNVVEVYVSYLRAKLGAGGEPPLLHTLRGRGYVLDARDPMGPRS
jgi:two-component system response regulator MprA